MPLDQPPLDNKGNVIPHDHQGIADEDRVIRRISLKQTVVDQNGERRISSIAFKPSTEERGGMSIDIEKLIIEAGKDPHNFVTSDRWPGSVLFDVGALRELGLRIGFDPLPNNPFHGEVWGKFSKSQQRSLRSLAIWFVPIDGVANC